MTTTITQWTSVAGPIQTKRVQTAIGKFRSSSTGVIELWGVKGVNEYQSHVTLLGDRGMVPDAVTAYNEIGEKYEWMITVANHKHIIANLERAGKSISLPIVDKRTTPEERAERDAEMTRRHDEYQKKQDDANEAWAKIMTKAPANAQAVIVARRVVDETDTMTDYFNSRVDEHVVIGFRTTKRESFKQLRAAAESFEHTKHLGPGRDEVTIHATYDNRPVSLPDALRDQTFTSEADAQSVIDSLTPGVDYPEGYEFRIRVESVEHRENYSMGAGNYLKKGGRHSSGWEVRSIPLNPPGDMYQDGIPDKTPTKSKPSPATTNNTDSTTGPGYAIETHYHTKRQTEFYIVVLGSRVGRDEFNTLRDSCKSAGGWYSRQWGNTPGGFAFADKGEAQSWAETTFGSDDAETTPTSTPPKPVQTDAAQKFLDLADRLSKNTMPGDYRTNTAKQRKQAAEARFKCSNEAHAEQAARMLAHAIKAGELPESLRAIRPTLKDLRGLTMRRRDTAHEGYYDVIPTNELESTDPLAATLKEWIESRSGGDGRRAEDLRRQNEYESIVHEKIPGFFPTPAAACETMVKAASLKPTDRVLEPSAGRGDLADAIAKEIGPGNIDCVEINPKLREIVGERYCLVGDDDFLQIDPDEWGTEYDAVLMNPPFERGQDRQHIMHAWRFLKPGGVLVAICSPSSTHDIRGKHKAEFDKWMNEVDAEIIDDNVGGFAATSIRTSMIRAFKPGG